MNVILSYSMLIYKQFINSSLGNVITNKIQFLYIQKGFRINMYKFAINKTYLNLFYQLIKNMKSNFE